MRVQAEDTDRKIEKSANQTTTTVKIGGDKVVEQHAAQHDKNETKIQKLNDKKSRKMDKAAAGQKTKPQSLQHSEAKAHPNENFMPKGRAGPDTNKPVPTAVFHGFKQSCYDQKVVENVNEIREGTGGIVECIEIGDGVQTSVFTSMVKQSKEACKKILEHPVFGKRQFNVVGISQGALIGRFVAETCHTPFPVRNFITIGGPNNGMEIGTDCTGHESKFRCEIFAKVKSFPLLDTYHKLVQQSLGPTNYVRNYHEHNNYLHKAIFLPYLNNEKENASFDLNKERFSKLNSLVMIQFNQDTVIFPKESEHFAQLDPAGKLVPMEATDLYTKNLFGLKTLDEEGRIFKITKEGDHLEYGPAYIQQVIVPALQK